MSTTAPEIRVMAQGETNTLIVDWGENTSGQETGVLKSGDTVTSCVVSVLTKPTGASEPTLGSVTAPNSTEYINGRACSTGEWTKCNIATASDQTLGLYVLKLTATTTNGKVLPRKVQVRVE